MNMKNLSGILLLFLCTFSVISCDKEADFKDKVKVITIYVSGETSTYTPSGSKEPIECMLVKEDGESEYSKLPMRSINAFSYEKGHEYVLKVEKTIPGNPSADAAPHYRLIEIIEDNTIDISPKWETLINDSREKETDISSRYLGIHGWWCIANPPSVYVGAVFPESTFATSFDKSVTEKKQPINLTFNFQIPYMTPMEDVRWIQYQKKMQEAIASKEYKDFKFPTRPYIVQFAELNSLDDLSLCINDNESFANTLVKIGKQELDIQPVKSLCVGKVVFKSFTVSMDIPVNGVFVEPPSNPDGLVYVRSLTYGTSAYFIIASKYQYQEVLSALRGPFIENYTNHEEVLKNSQIILLTVSDINQTANIGHSFADLQTYLNNPFMDGYTYGYPIFCKGYYVKDNNLYVEQR